MTGRSQNSVSRQVYLKKWPVINRMNFKNQTLFKTLFSQALRFCVALFIDLSKVCDNLLEILLHIAKQASCWFADYVASRTRFGVSATFLEITNGVVQGSVLGPILLTVNISDMCADLSNASYNFHGDKCVIYCCSHATAQRLNFPRPLLRRGRLQPEKLVVCTKKSKNNVFQIHPSPQKIFTN